MNRLIPCLLVALACLAIAPAASACLLGDPIVPDPAAECGGVYGGQHSLDPEGGLWIAPCNIVPG